MDNYIAHYGIKRKSGRYPWGSGDKPYQSEPNQAKRYYAEKKAARKNGTETDVERKERVGRTVGKIVAAPAGVGAATASALSCIEMGKLTVANGFSTAVAFGAPTEMILMAGWNGIIAGLVAAGFAGAIAAGAAGAKYWNGANWSEWYSHGGKYGTRKYISEYRREYKKKHGFTNEIRM